MTMHFCERCGAPEGFGCVCRAAAAPPHVPRPATNFVSEVRPDLPNPSCHVCGALTVATVWKCTNCGTSTEPSEVSREPISAEQLAKNFLWAELTNLRYAINKWFTDGSGSVAEWEKLTNEIERRLAAKLRAYAHSLTTQNEEK